MGDYKKARLYYSDAIANMNNILYGGAMSDLEGADSKLQ